MSRKSPNSLQFISSYSFITAPRSDTQLFLSHYILRLLRSFIPAKILDILLYPWDIFPEQIDPGWVDFPFRHFDEDLFSPYFHSLSSIRRVFLNHHCSFRSHSRCCPHFFTFLRFERSINHDFYHTYPSFPDLEFFLEDPVFLICHPPTESTNNLNYLFPSALLRFQYHPFFLWFRSSLVNSLLPSSSSSSSLNVLSIDSLSSSFSDFHLQDIFISDIDDIDE